MSDDEFDDDAELDEGDLDEDDIDEEFDDEDDDDDALIDDELADDELADDADGDVAEGDEDEEDGAVTAAKKKGASDEDDDVVDLDEELHPDDVEEALDVVLRERTAAVGLEDEEDDFEEPAEGGEGGTKIVPRRENEFLCKSCFLVLPRHQLADEARMICRDCA